MKHYVYFIWTAASLFTKKEIIFECDASSLLEADKQYEAATGKNVVKSGAQCMWS